MSNEYGSRNYHDPHNNDEVLYECNKITQTLSKQSENEGSYIRSILRDETRWQWR